MGLADLPLIIGHRGAKGLAPENTLPSFQLAYEMGVSAIELDVHSVAGHLVVIHDDTLERTTDGRGKVSDLELTALRSLDAGNGHPIPLLEEVLADLPQEIGINIELKGENTAQPTAECVHRNPEVDLLVSSFDHRELARFHQLKPEVRIAPLFHRWPRNAWQRVRELDAWSINLSRKIVNAAILEQANFIGVKSLVYTVNDVLEARRVLNDGATGVFTDYPDVITRAALTD